MKKLLFAVLVLCMITVNTANAQQHNRGVSGLTLSATGLYTSKFSFGGEAMYIHYLTRNITLQGGVFWDRIMFSVEQNSYPIDTYGVRADALYLILKGKGFYLNLGAGLGLGLENVSLAKKRLQEQYIIIENLKNRFSLGLEAKIQAEYFVLPELALVSDVRGVYRPFSNTYSFIPALSLGIKKLF